MAKFSFALLMTVLATALAGCQQDSVVRSLPPQNFNGPQLARPVPAPVAAQPKIAAPVNTGRINTAMVVPREWTPTVAAKPWRWIVIHHSATPTGGAAAFDRMHKAKGWDELGYHFVVGNGTDTRDGLVEVGSRWPVQKHGAHTKTPDNRYNEQGIGICLVGNFDLTSPSSEQMKSVARLVAFLQRTYRIPSDRILGHGQAKPTDCPGKYLSVAEVRRQSMRIIADAGDVIPPDIAPPVETTLLHPIPGQ